MGLIAKPFHKGRGGVGCAKQSTFFVSSDLETAHDAGNTCGRISADQQRFDAQVTHSIADRGTGGLAGVAGAVEPAVRDLDQLDGAPRPLLDELVAHAVELASTIKRDEGGFRSAVL